MKVGINGFGRIGRAVFKICMEKGIEVVAVNDLQDTKQMAYLLRNDTVYGRYGKKVEVRGDDLIVDGKKIIVLSEKNPEKLGWGKLGVDVVVESTGFFTNREGAEKHIQAGAKHVLISAPAKDKVDLVVVPGVNSEDVKNQKIISVASCTTNCISPVLKVLNDEFVIKNCIFTTIHAYTSSQNVVDSPNKKHRRGRSAGLNIIPTTTGASKAVIQVLPELEGKVKGMALRVPVPDGSITDMIIEFKKKVGAKEVNSALKKAANGKMKGIIEYSEEELVSSMIIGNSHSSIVDSSLTDDNEGLVKVLVWYDNEWGYSCRVVDVIDMLG